MTYLHPNGEAEEKEFAEATEKMFAPAPAKEEKEAWYIEEFRNNFYEGNSNSVHCKEHKVYATPFEIEALLHKVAQKTEEKMIEKMQTLQIPVEYRGRLWTTSPEYWPNYKWEKCENSEVYFVALSPEANK